MKCNYDEILQPDKVNNYDDIFSIFPKYDVYYTHARMFPTSSEIVNDKIDYKITLKDVDMFNINTSCQTNAFRRKYVVGSPIKVSGVEVHNVGVNLKITKT